MQIEHGPRTSKLLSEDGKTIFEGKKEKVTEMYIRLSFAKRKEVSDLAYGLRTIKPHQDAVNKLMVWEAMVNKICEIHTRHNPFFNEDKFKRDCFYKGLVVGDG